MVHAHHAVVTFHKRRKAEPVHNARRQQRFGVALEVMGENMAFELTGNGQPHFLSGEIVFANPYPEGGLVVPEGFKRKTVVFGLGRVAVDELNKCVAVAGSGTHGYAGNYGVNMAGVL